MRICDFEVQFGRKFKHEIIEFPVVFLNAKTLEVGFKETAHYNSTLKVGDRRSTRYIEIEQCSLF